MAGPQQTASSARPPPDVPNDPTLSTQVSAYLRNFALWCRNGFQDSLRSHEALPGVLVRAYDAPQGTVPKVFMIRVNTAGAVSAVAVPLGGGNPGP
jgi:hypothetical protein